MMQNNDNNSHGLSVLHEIIWNRCVYDKITSSWGSKFVVSIISEDFNQVAAGQIGDLGWPDPAQGL